MFYLNNYHIDILTRNVPCPQRLNIELTTNCNLKCVMCRGSQNYVEEKKVGRHVTSEDFLRILNGIDLNRLRVLNLAGSAESLLNPDIVPILAICRENRIIAELITNGMLLTPQISKQLLGNSSEIHISFGGAKRETFEAIRQGADFELICENIRTLSRLKGENNQRYPQIWLNPILMKRNIHELPAVIELAKELGCHGVACSHLIVDSPELIGESLFFHKQEANHYLQKAEEVAKRDQISLVRPANFSLESDGGDKRETIESWKACRFLWNYAILGVEGIVPCSGSGELKFDCDGSVIRNKFMDIWNGDWYATMRYKLLTGNPPQYCRNCTDPSVKDPNRIGSYFKEEVLPEVFDYAKKDPTLSQKSEFEQRGDSILSGIEHILVSKRPISCFL